jgi:hypothetical protein
MVLNRARGRWVTQVGATRHYSTRRHLLVARLVDKVKVLLFLAKSKGSAQRSVLHEGRSSAALQVLLLCAGDPAFSE